MLASTLKLKDKLANSLIFVRLGSTSRDAEYVRPATLGTRAVDRILIRPSVTGTRTAGNLKTVYNIAREIEVPSAVEGKTDILSVNLTVRAPVGVSVDALDEALGSIYCIAFGLAGADSAEGTVVPPGSDSEFLQAVRIGEA